MNCYRNAALLATLFAVACGPAEPSGDDAIVIVTDDNASNGGQTNASGNNAVTNNASTNNTTTTTGSTNNTSGPTNNTSGATNNTTGSTNNTTGTNNTNNTTSPEPCGNGMIDDGELCDGDCPASCNDNNPCTQDVMTGSPDTCDSQCTNTPDAACDAWSGTYTGDYYVLAESKVGSSVINSMECVGTFDVTVDTAQTDTVSGTADCTYSGGLTAFDDDQTATMAGKINPDGTFSARISHESGSPNTGYFNIDGTVVGGTLLVDDTSSWKPHPMDAFPWEVTVKLD